MRNLLSILLLALPFTNSMAQGEAEYYLPKTELRFQILIEKTEYTPGEFAIYSERFLRKTANEQSSTEYRVVGISMYTTAIPDTAKLFTLPLDKKHTIFNVERSSNGILQAVNAKRKVTTTPEPFTPAKKEKAVNPHDYMSEDILSAGSKSKMAELTAREIYDIREARNELNRGEAEYMPKDGEQMRLMLANLDRQENILMQTFQGVTEKDTIQQEITFCPSAPEENDEASSGKILLFRFSKLLGLVDMDDMAGTPYYIRVEELNIIPKLKTAADGEKRSKDEASIMVNMPGKIKVTIIKGNTPITSYELYAAQFGKLESLSGSLFGRKMTSHLQLSPITGNVESLETEPLD